MAGIHSMGVRAGSHATPSQKKRLGKLRGLEPGDKDLPECRTIIMMKMIT